MKKMSENAKRELIVTNIEDIKRQMNGELVELPGFTSGTTFVARLKRPSMLSMVKRGRIPNELLVEANKLFSNGPSKTAITNQVDPKMMSNMFEIIELICTESFVEPSYRELKDNGIELTDEQQLAIFSYTQRGIESLKSFRQ